ncbi:MAG: alpha-hydroxy-acid oxidizing protein [Actinomycetota bacterium]|nr:alpha-hydroxy-acid oxidizing protein [Actinomycetota bacterium]
MPHFGDFQLALYLAGLGGEKPPYPVTFDGLEAVAGQILSAEAFAYVAGSAGSETTARANRAAFDHWQITPRLLQGVTERDLSTEVCGTALPAPVLLAPIGSIGIVHPEGELAVAQAASPLGVPMILSTVSSHSMEEVAAALAGGDPPGTGWYQLYWPKDREVALSLVSRAERAGFRALVVTLDTWALAWRPRDLQHAFLPMLRGLGIANYLTDPAFRAGLSRPPEEDPAAAVLHWAAMFGNPALTWADIASLRDHTTLPIVVKGVCHPDDARAAIDAGVDALVVSNHGGRQIDGARPALDCLPGVCAVAGEVPVLFDSGIRTGSDIVKAVALGARAVLVGRPYVYGLAVGGADGVRHMLRCLLAELDLTVALSGHASVTSLGPEILVRARP